MADILNEILNEEFDTICEDSSVEGERVARNVA